MDPETGNPSDKTSILGMVHESQFLEIEILDSTSPVENKAGVSSPARRAGGPRTPKGKERSKHNSLKHGLFSKAVLLKDEPRDEYESMLNGLRDNLQPVGTLESFLVERLATQFWRQRRLLIAESAEIQKSRKFVEWDEAQAHERQATEVLRFPDVFSGGLIWRINNRILLQRCIDLLVDFRENVMLGGFDPERDTETLIEIYGPYHRGSLQVTLLLSYLMMFPEGYCPDEMLGPPDTSLDNSINEFLRELDAEIERLNRYKTDESERKKLSALSRSVPDAMQMDRLLRYGTSLDREMDRTLKQLERLQRMRRGQPLPPQIDVNVSSEE